MKLAKYLRPSRIILPLTAGDKWAAIDELLEKLALDGAVLDAEQARADLIAREKRMSTGMEHGLAIPHAKTKGVSELVVGVGIALDGIEFESLDGRPARIVFLVLSRADVSGPHVECIAEIAKACSDVAVREAVLRAKSAAEIIAALRG